MITEERLGQMKRFEEELLGNIVDARMYLGFFPDEHSKKMFIYDFAMYCSMSVLSKLETLIWSIKGSEQFSEAYGLAAAQRCVAESFPLE